MEDKLEPLFDTIVTQYTKCEWLELIKRIEKYIQFCERDTKRFRKNMIQRGVPLHFIERECIWRSALNGFITTEEARERMKSTYNTCIN